MAVGLDAMQKRTGPNYFDPNTGQQLSGPAGQPGSNPLTQQPQFSSNYQMNVPQQGGGWWDSFKTFLSDLFLGKEAAIKQLQNFTPEQQQVFSTLMQSGLNQYQNRFQGFEPIRQETMRQYYENILPSLGERFGASRSRLSSPAFAQQLGSSASGLASMLGAQQANYGLQSGQQGLQAAQLGLTPQFSNITVPGQPGLLAQGLDRGAQVAPYLAKAYFGGV